MHVCIKRCVIKKNPHVCTTFVSNGRSSLNDFHLFESAQDKHSSCSKNKTTGPLHGWGVVIGPIGAC